MPAIAIPIENPYFRAIPYPVMGESDSDPTEIQCDVAILGGAFSGAAAAVQILRKNPDAKVVIVEKAKEFDRKVGESTTEVSGCFLTRVLGLSNYLGHQHLPKQGLRLWFHNGQDQDFEDCREVGARYNVRLPAFQVDRSTLDEHLLSLATEEGATLLRPCKVKHIEMGPEHQLTVEAGEKTLRLRARYLIDASGRAAVLSRKLGLFRKLDRHPINALWARLKKTTDWDGFALRRRFPEYARACRTTRAWATNHFCGHGWWCWTIPLRGGDVSVGLVYDSRLFQAPTGDSIGERLLKHLHAHPMGRELFGEAEVVDGDARAFSMLPYYSEQVAGANWAMAGDAASFIDPLYSPGLDFCSFTSSIAADLALRSLKGEDLTMAVENYNKQFAFTYQAWFETLYLDKYHYMGDADLMSAAVLMDVATFFLGPVRQVYRDPEQEFLRLPFEGVGGRVFARFMRLYNRRLVKLAHVRRRKGIYGIHNCGGRDLFDGFLPDHRSGKLLWMGMKRWWKAEWQTFWMANRHQEEMAPSPMPRHQSGVSER